jgi:NodT family efflux transporter outer membrane factor (OMF) lipoprotein
MKLSRATQVTAILRRRGAAPLAVVLLSLAVLGCAAGPDFKAPAPPATTGYVPPGETAASEHDPGQAVSKQSLALGAEVESDWWTLFQSPELEHVVQQAIAGSRTLESAKARLTQAHEAIAASSSALYPQVGLTAGVAREKVSATEFGLGPRAFPLPPNFNLLQVGPTASYTLDLFGGARRRIEQQSALADYQRDQLAVAYLTLTGNTVAEAIQVATIRGLLKAVGDILDIDRENLELVRKERQAGTVPDSDVVIAESQLAKDETLRPELEQQLSAAMHALAVLLGRAPGDWTPPDFDLAKLTLPENLPVCLPSELVHQRPDIRAAEAQLHAASAEIGIATAQLYPAITLSAAASTSALDARQLFDSAGLVWSIAAGLTQPIFDGGLRRAQRRAALAAFKASAADYQETVLEAFGQIADILQALSHDTQLLAAQQHALDMASQSVRLQRTSYSRGGTGILNLLDAQRQYQQALLAYTRAQAMRYQDTIQLLVAMGGGWSGANITVSENNQAPVMRR